MKAALRRWLACGVAAGPLALGSAASAIVVDLVTVGDPGNAADPDPNTELCIGYDQPCGAVASTYRIGKYEVTNAQYTVFLNAVAASDPNGLYHPDMGSLVTYGGIARSGTDGSYTYAVTAGRENLPVNNVSWHNAARFANWLHHGQPIGAQGLATTEEGAYTMPDPSVRNPGALVFLPTEDEWYKAAYYAGSGTTYYDYPAGSDAEVTCSGATATPNSANCDDAVGDLLPVGSYTGSPGPYGTFDQGGNVYEWNETDIFGDLGARGSRGGSAFDDVIFLGADEKTDFYPYLIFGRQGFRIAVAPEPSGGLMLLAGALAVALCARYKHPEH